MTPSLSISSSSSTSTMLFYPKLGTTTTCAMSLSTTSYSKTQQFYLYSLRQRLFSPWNGLNKLGFLTKPKKPIFHIIGIILILT
jgi:hypothetical protein